MLVLMGTLTFHWSFVWVFTVANIHPASGSLAFLDYLVCSFINFVKFLSIICSNISSAPFALMSPVTYMYLGL